MHTVYDLVPSLAAALNIGHSQSHNLSPAAAKLRNRFKDLVGFDRGIIHELGHAVVAVHLGHPLVRVTIAPDGNLGGSCFYNFSEEEFDFRTFAIQRAIVVSAARVAVVKAIEGYELTEADFTYTIDSYYEEYGHDDQHLRNIASDLNIWPGIYEGWVEEVSAEAWRILPEHLGSTAEAGEGTETQPHPERRSCAAGAWWNIVTVPAECPDHGHCVIGAARCRAVTPPRGGQDTGPLPTP